MYLYLYDSFLVDQKYKKIIDRIETRLTDLGINGKNVRLTILKNANEIVRDNLRQGAQTIVAIGGDALFAEVAIAAAGSGATVGFIPVDNSVMAEVLGIPPDEFACDIISGRRVERVDLGKINEQYFLSSLQIDSQHLKLKCDDSYQISPVAIKGVKIINLDWLNFSWSQAGTNFIKNASNPKDGMLEVVLAQKPKVILPFFKKVAQKDSLFYVKRLYIESADKKEVTIAVDQSRVFKAPALVEIVPDCLKIIIGKEKLIWNFQFLIYNFLKNARH